MRSERITHIRKRSIAASFILAAGVLTAAAVAAVLGGALSVAFAGGGNDRPGGSPPVASRTLRLQDVDLAAPLPDALVRPEGTTRWDLASIQVKRTFERSFEENGGAVTVIDEGPGQAGKRSRSRLVYSDPVGEDAAARWLFPDRFAADLRPGSRDALEVEEDRGGASDRLRIETEIVGIGWVHLPSGPREVVVQRAFVSRTPLRGSSSPPSESVLHRWIDPRAGVVAEIAGALSGAGTVRAESAYVLDVVIESAATLKIYLAEHEAPNFADVSLGRDRGAGTTVASITPNGYANIGALIAANTWDFSGNTTGAEVAATTTPVDPNETCNYAQCGYTVPGGQLERTDKNFTDPNNIDKVNDVIEKQVDPNIGVTFWLRGGSQHEGRSGGFGDGESRFCYVTFGGVTRTPVPLWRFPHFDATRNDWYYTSGDHWEGGPFNCEQNTFNQVCGASQVADVLWTKACGTHTGKHLADALKGGVVTLPSGHTFNALLVRNTADFCVYIASGCLSIFKVSEVRTVNYLWQVPNLGTVVRLQSEQNVADANTFSILAESYFGFGLYPPRTITVTGSTATSVSISWDPGLDTHRINGYKIYWDTDSGSVSPYAFNSEANAGQISIAGATATISGLAQGVTYYVTVTSKAVFTDPSTHVATTYESLLYPTQVSGDPNFIYPVEVQAATSCPSGPEVSGVSVVPDPNGIRICWSPVTDSCLLGYRIRGSTNAISPAGYSVVGDTGPVTCWTGNPSQIYYITNTRRSSGEGPWGHYGQ